MGNARKLLAVLLFASLAMRVSAEQQSAIQFERPPASPIRFSEPWRPVGSAAEAETAVVGVVVDARRVPVSSARVQLRDLRTGLVVATDVTDVHGAYEFSPLDPGTYVVELVKVDDYVIAVSNAGAIARAEQLDTIIQLPGRWDSASKTVIPTVKAISFLGIGAATSMTRATLSLAVDNQIPPVDAGEPVSPR